MNKVFVDTSAFLAFLSKTDAAHGRALKSFERLRTEGAALLISSYVLVETYALLDRRLGKEAARRFREDLCPLLEVIWVQQDLHDRAMEVYLDGARSVSLVDAVSFVVSRDFEVERVWAIDHHFEQEGFEVIP